MKKWGTHNRSWCKLWNICKFLNMKIRRVKLLLHSAVTIPHVINNHVHNVIPCQSLQLYKRKHALHPNPTFTITWKLFFSTLQYRIVGQYRHVSGHTYDIRRTDYYYKYFTVFIPKKQITDPDTKNTVLLQIQTRTFLINRNAAVRYPSKRKEINAELLCVGQGKVHFKSMNFKLWMQFCIK
jgi:hypothetical protein